MSKPHHVLKLTCAFTACLSVAIACGSDSGKRTDRDNRNNQGEGGQSGADAERSNAGNSQTAGSSQGGTKPGGQANGSNDAGSVGNSGQGQGGAEGVAGPAPDGGKPGDDGQSGEAGAGAGSGGAGGSTTCEEAMTSVGANLLNGSFELPALPSPSWLVIDPGQEPTGFAWSVLVNVDMSRVGWSSMDGAVTGPAKDGIQYLDVVGFGEVGALRQTVDVVPGASYVVKLSYANNPVTSPRLASASATVTARVCDHIIFSETITHSSSSIDDFDWTDFSQTFLATDSIVTLEIIETVGGGNGGIYLDAVSLTPAP